MGLILIQVWHTHEREREGKTAEKITFINYNDKSAYFYSNSCEFVSIFSSLSLLHQSQ